MQLSVAHDDYRPYQVIEEFESLIWTDRYADYGEFELIVKEEWFLNYTLKDFRFLRFSESGRIMMIETIDIADQEVNNYDDGQGNRIVIRGRSLEAFLKFRTNTAPNGNPPQGYNDRIPNIIARIMGQYVINPLNPEDKIPGLELGWIIPNRPIVSRFVDRGIIYDVVKGLCDEYGYGWSIYPLGDGKLGFSVYRGTDNTNRYSLFYREFSEETQTMLHMKYLQSITNWRNHARVEGARQVVDVYQGLPDTLGTHAGFNRRTLVVQASDVGTDEETSPADDIPILRARGEAALREEANKYISVVSGEIPTIEWSRMSYGLGDLVRVKDFYGDKSKMRIVEDTWSLSGGVAKRFPGLIMVPENTEA